MELLGIGPMELLVILIIAVIIFSPQDLAKGGKTLGHWINRLYRSDTWKSMKQVSQEMQNLPNRLAREAQLDELKDLEQGINLDGSSPYARRSPANPKPPAAQNRGAETASPPKTAPQPDASPETKNSEKNNLKSAQP
jgi:sec-independent protein translocase protein TatB